MQEDFRPWTWKVPEGVSPVDNDKLRQDGHDKISGQAVFTRDVELPGMLYAKILTSPFAHARIVRMDTSKAEVFFGGMKLKSPKESIKEIVKIRASRL